MNTTIEGAMRLADEHNGARKQRDRLRARIREIAKSSDGMNSGLEAVMVYLHLEDMRERQEDKPTDCHSANRTGVLAHDAGVGS